jgi:ribonuclease D
MPEIVADEPTLAGLAATLPPLPLLGVDCEFVRERTYWPQLGLIQLQAGERTLLVDPLPLPDGRSLQALFARAELCVMHAPGEDFECFLHRFGWLPARLFDTQLAAAYAGLGSGLSYRALVERYCGVVLEKAETRSDWTRRPLSEAQLRYAAEDVIHLPAVHAALAAALDQRGQRARFEEDCARSLERARQQFDDPLPQLEPRQLARLDQAGAERLQRILVWREREARRADRPRGWILDNETCQRLAAAPDGDEAAHRRIVDAAPRAARQAPAALWQVLADRSEALPPLPRAGNAQDARYKAALQRLQDAVAEVAARLDLPASLLFPRRQIEQLLDARRWPESARGWREAELAPVLLPLLPD